MLGEKGIQKTSGSNWILGFSTVEGQVKWPELRSAIEKLTRNWRMSGEGWGDLSVTVIHSDKDALMDLRDDIYYEFGGDSYILFDDEEE